MLLACRLAASSLSELIETYTAAGHALTAEYNPLLSELKDNMQNIMTSCIDRLLDSGAADELYMEAQEALIIFHGFENFEHSPSENDLEKLLDMLKTVIKMGHAYNNPVCQDTGRMGDETELESIDEGSWVTDDRSSEARQEETIGRCEEKEDLEMEEAEIGDARLDSAF
jgi:hypothetical protein